MKDKTLWLRLPEAHDYPAAESYLNLIFEAETAAKMVKKLRAAKVAKFKAKDIFRASGLPLLGPTNFHVRRDHKKLVKGERVSPLLLVRQPKAGRVIIADGYHRLCAAYSLNEDAVIPCKIALG
jgi:hypothetical protein